MPDMQSTTALTDCPLCGLAAVAERTVNDEYIVQCNHCGDFAVSDLARVLVTALPKHFLVALRQALVAHRSAADIVHITLNNVGRLVAPYL